MNALSGAIKLFVKGVLDEASKKIAEKFDVSVEEASAIWDDIQLDLETIKTFNIPSKTVDKPVVKKSTKSTKTKKDKVEIDSDNESEEVEKETSDGCVHKLLRGPRSGDCCGDKISNKSQTGNYCTKHIAHENKTQAEKKTSKKDKDVDEKKDAKYTISKNKFGNYCHTPSGLVFRSAKEKVVYGRQDSEGDLHPLTEEDIQICKKYKFPMAKDPLNEEPLTNKKKDKEIDIDEEVDEESEEVDE